MYTSRLEAGKKKEEDNNIIIYGLNTTTSLFTRQPCYQQYTHIINYDYLPLQKANRNKGNIFFYLLSVGQVFIRKHLK